MRKDLANVGIRVEFKPAKWAENSKNVRAGNVMIWRYGNMAVAPDSGQSLARGFSGHIGGQNLARFRNNDYDSIYKKIGSDPRWSRAARALRGGKESSGCLCTL